MGNKRFCASTSFTICLSFVTFLQSCGARSALIETTFGDSIRETPTKPSKPSCTPGATTFFSESVSFNISPEGLIPLYKEGELYSKNPWDIIVTDINQDAHHDLVVIGKDSNQIFFMSGDGSGSFHTSHANLVPESPSSASNIDVDRDGRLDIAVSFESTPTIDVFLAHDNFQSKISFQAEGSGVSHIVSGDFNKDGFSDFATINNHEKTVHVSTKKLDKFSHIFSVDVNIFPSAIVSADLNGDQIDDLALTGVDDDMAGHLLVFFGVDGGSLSEAHSYATTGASTSLSVADLNNDGFSDLVVGNSFGDDADGFSEYIDVFFNNKHGTFDQNNAIKSGKSPDVVATKDLNNDGIIDVIVGNSLEFNLSVFMGTGDGKFLSPKNIKTNGQPRAISFGDFNEDCLTDIAVANYFNGTVAILLNTSR